MTTDARHGGSCFDCAARLIKVFVWREAGASRFIYLTLTGEELAPVNRENSRFARSARSADLARENPAFPPSTRDIDTRSRSVDGG
jgi:hypothetical protein